LAAELLVRRHLVAFRSDPVGFSHHSFKEVTELFEALIFVSKIGNNVIPIIKDCFLIKLKVLV